MAAASMAGAVALVLLGGATPASAHWLDNTFPDAPGSYCMNGAYVIYSGDITVGEYPGAPVVGTMQVWYSPGCGTNWVRALNNSPYLKITKAIRHEPADGVGIDETDWANGWSYSEQIYAPGSQCVHATALIWNTSTGDFYAWDGVILC
jgi:hypothetical protein